MQQALDMRRFLPALFYLIAALLIYPLIVTFGNMFKLLDGKGARSYLILYSTLPFLIIAAMIFCIYLAIEIKHYQDIGD